MPMLPYVDLENYELVFSRQRIPLNVRILDKMYPPVVFIVAGTKKKIWDIYDDYPAKESAQYAYKGETFQHWLDVFAHTHFVISLNNAVPYKEYIDPHNVIVWYVFSPKYGIIQPYELIENYDIEAPNIAVPEEQILKQIKSLGINKAKDVYFVDSHGYYDRLKEIFAKANIDLKLLKL